MLSRFLAVMIMFVLSGAAKAQELPARYKSANALTVAMFPAFPPLAYRDPATNAMIGVDLELGEALAKELGVTMKWTDVNFESAIPALRTKRIDFALSMVNVEESRDTLIFIDYIKSGAQFFTLAGNTTPDRPESFCGKRVGASRRGPFTREMEKWSHIHCAGAGLPPIVAVGTEGSPDARSQMKQGRLDGVVQSAESLPYIMQQEPGTYRLVGRPFTDTHIAIATLKKDIDLGSALKAAFNRLIASGEYERVLAKYGLAELKVGKRD